jgi:hypothetical protein
MGSPTRWPNLFLVGAAKAGTTTLYGHLRAHPSIFMSPLKEPHFFSRIRTDPARAALYPYVSEPQAYLELFAGAGTQPFRGEASASYLWDRGAADRIAAACPDAWIVISLRDPVERAYSNYWNDIREGLDDRQFLTAIKEELRLAEPQWGLTSLYVDCGWYAAAVRRYLELFPDRVAVLFFERFIVTPKPEMRALFERLRLDPTVADSLPERADNRFRLPRGSLAGQLLGSPLMRRVARAALPRSVRPLAKERFLLRTAAKPPMDPRARRLLEDIYEDDSRELAATIGPLPWWPRRRAVATSTGSHGRAG